MKRDLCLMWAPRYQAVHRQVEEVKKVVDQTVTGSLVRRRFYVFMSASSDLQLQQVLHRPYQ